eukprot:scaffold59421_cov62-Phaeocystis_antarctica.AAC.1
MTPMWRPLDRGQSPRTVRPPRPHPACTSRSCWPWVSGRRQGPGGRIEGGWAWVWVSGRREGPGGRIEGSVGPRHTVRRMQGCRDRSRGNCVPRCGILGSVGGGYRPCGRPAPSRHARTASAETLWLIQGMVVRRTTGHGGALTPGERTKGATDAGMHCTRCQGPPTHAQHDRRPRGGQGGARAVVARGARAEGRLCDWVAELGVWGTSIACQRRRKAILVVSSGEGNLPRQDCHLAGDVPSWALRTTLCKTDIRSRPLWRRRTRWWGQSYIVRRS